MESKQVKSINILCENSDMFNTNYEYIIPLYQRGYEWKDKEISQLIEDINDIDISKQYYIGTLIVAKNQLENQTKYEIIDGQQRLTTLFLILNFIKDNIKNSLKFACRDKSNYTLEHIQDIINVRKNKIVKNKLEENLIDHNIEIAIDIINDKLKELKKKNSIEDFKKKLSNVIIYQIEVPENTDLNHYFEIMNTRGEQLAQTDILKAKLMSYLKNSSKEQYVFSTIWDACSDMNSYVQMNFTTDSDLRKKIFGENWNNLSVNTWEEVNNLIKNDSKNEKLLNIEDIINTKFKIEGIDYENDKDKQIKFESIISFPFFLIHVLKLYIKECLDEQIKVDEMLDDKKLIKTFHSVIDNINEEEKEEFSKNYIIFMLKCRFLFDKFIIKRKYLKEDDNGQWSLQELNVSSKKPYYKNTPFRKKYEKNITSENRNTDILMLQSLLRVTYTSPKIMYWITELLEWLVKDNCKNAKEENICEFAQKIENYIINEVNANFLDLENPYSRGVDTHHIVFNYLDYLIWKKEKNQDFVFEFRNSVEHWYPQNPSIGTFEEWKNKDELNHFGNLCLIQRNINSKFSNMAPSAKKDSYKDMICKGSLKLRKMAECTITKNNVDANTYWKNEEYKKHGNEMIKILKEACNR